MADPDSLRQSQEAPNLSYSSVYFNNSSVKEYSKQNHFEMFFDFKLDFQEDCKYLIKHLSKAVALQPKFQNILPRSVLHTIMNLLLELISIMAILFMIQNVLILNSRIS